MNDAHDNEATDKEMFKRYNPAHTRAYLDTGPGGVVRPSPIHTNPSVQHIDIRFYFGEKHDPKEILDNISTMIQDSEMSVYIISAYQLKNNGFGHLLPDDKPLA